MRDLISREAALKLILSGRVGDDSHFECPEECNSMLEWAADGASKMPAADVPDRKVGKWIPVSERLPKEDTDVLISYRYKEGEGDTSHVYIDITSYGDMYFGGRKVKDAKHWRQPFAYFTSNYEVIAWMPLPEPWKGEEG